MDANAPMDFGSDENDAIAIYFGVAHVNNIRASRIAQNSGNDSDAKQ